MPRYNWVEVQKYHDDKHTREECMRHFGFCAASWTNAKRRGDLKQQRASYAPEDVAAFRDRGRVRRVLLAQGVIQNVCYECGITHWFGEQLSLHLDHINGVGDDNRIENLRMLCANCHSQTETFSGRNTRWRRGSQA